jgi:hypothetical protein
VLLDNIAYSKFKLNENETMSSELLSGNLKLRDSLKLSSGIFINKIHLSEYFAFQMIIKSIRYSKEALALARGTKVSRYSCSIKQLSIIEPRTPLYNKEYIQINERLQKEERSMERNLVSNMKQIKLKIKTLFRGQNRNLVYAIGLLNNSRTFYLYHKTKKTKTESFVQATTAES